MSTSSLKDFLFYVMINHADTYQVISINPKLPENNRIVKPKLFYHVDSEGYYGWLPEVVHTLETMLSSN